MNVYKGSFSAVQPISISYTLSLWPVPEYEGQLSANFCHSRETGERQDLIKLLIRSNKDQKHNVGKRP
jgi:hypothetical protein